jgi:uncharacterized membrane protein
VAVLAVLVAEGVGQIRLKMQGLTEQTTLVVVVAVAVMQMAYQVQVVQELLLPVTLQQHKKHQVVIK